jgi:hypothetical protein
VTHASTLVTQPVKREVSLLRANKTKKSAQRKLQKS